MKFLPLILFITTVLFSYACDAQCTCYGNNTPAFYNSYQPIGNQIGYPVSSYQIQQPMGYLNQQQTYNMPNYGKPNNNSLTDVGAILNAIGQIIGVYQEIRSNGNQPTYTQQQPVYYYPSNYLLAY